jgi:hypothetical protein
VPNPGCFDIRVQEIRKGVEDAVRDVGKTTTTGTRDTGTAIEKAAQDAGKVIERAASSPSAISRLIILATGYSHLAELGKEEPGYGLYSYAVFASDSPRSSAFLAEVFKSIPNIEDTPAQRAQLNIFYIPIKKESTGDFADSVKSLGKDPTMLGSKYSETYYDYKMARAI